MNNPPISAEEIAELQEASARPVPDGAMNPEDAEEFTQSVVQVLAGGMRLANLGAERLGIPQALGLSQQEWVDRKISGGVRMSVPERRAASVHLTTPVEDGGAGLSNRKAASELGVGEATVRRDLESAASNGADEDGSKENEQDSEPLNEATAPNDALDQEDAPEYEQEQKSSAYDEPELNDTAEPEAAETAQDAGPNDAAEEQEPEAEVVEEPEPLEPLAPGWHQVGPHWLYCGDSTNEEFINACEGSFAFADPPYNAGKAAWDEDFTWQHDYLAEAAGIVAVTPGIAALPGFHTLTTMPYQWSIAAEVTNGMTRGALGFGNWIYVALFSNGSIYRNSKDVIRLPAHTSDDEGGGHVARKPLRLLTELIGLFTSKGDTVVDPFLGSGTTLLAADRLERRCIGAEIDPMHCAEIIARYQESR